MHALSLAQLLLELLALILLMAQLFEYLLDLQRIIIFVHHLVQSFALTVQDSLLRRNLLLQQQVLPLGFIQLYHEVMKFTNLVFYARFDSITAQLTLHLLNLGSVAAYLVVLLLYYVLEGLVATRRDHGHDGLDTIGHRRRHTYGQVGVVGRARALLGRHRSRSNTSSTDLGHGLAA